MYEIRPESIKTFITDRNIKLPRFQRKQTWDEKKSFQLCISLFKEYPIGVCILSVDESKGRIIRWLLDGRQRKNTLLMMYDDPENIYNWAKKFINFKNSDQPSEISEKFWEKINEYIEADADEENGQSLEDDYDDSTNIYENNAEETVESSYGLEFLLNIILVIHNKSKKNTGFTKPFDFTKYIDKLPYLENIDGGIQLSSRKVKTFIDEYRNYCDDENVDFDSEKSLYDFLDRRCDVKDENKAKKLIHEKWLAIKERMIIVEKIEDLLMNSKIGIIEVKKLTPSDSQKIFNIINTEGEPLTAVEILSAKPHWNISVDNPSQSAIDAVKMLYKRIGTVQTDVVRWDLPASLISRIGANIIFKKFKDSDTDFSKELTIGFKILSGIYIGGVKKEDIENLSKTSNINWSSDIETLIYDFNLMFKLISGFDYFKYFKSWRISMMELTSDAIALNFIILAYKDWIRKGKPVGDVKAKQFQKNCFILWDKLVFEYITKQWRGSSDSKIANNILNTINDLDVFVPIKSYKWENILQNDIFDGNRIDTNPISLSLMKPLLYHFYCLSSIQAPDTDYELEIDHILPQSLFKESSISDKDIIKDNLLNLGILPKNENISKGNKKLTQIDSQWLKDQIAKYEFIEESKYQEYSNVNNYKKLFDDRKKVFLKAYIDKRNNILNN